MLNDMQRRKIITPVTTTSVFVKENGEALHTFGGDLLCAPFWLSSDVLIQEVEGKYYLPYISNHTDFKLMVRQGVVERLELAQTMLPRSWGVVVMAGFRPLEVQRAMFEAYLKQLHEEHANWNDEQCVEYAGRYVSNPDTGAKPHTTGGAVDIDVYDNQTNRLVDMGCKICEVGEVSHLLRGGLTDEQRRNQETLLEAMLAAGFAPNAREWWHYSYGDQRWAAFYGKTHAVYGVTDETRYNER